MHTSQLQPEVRQQISTEWDEMRASLVRIEAGPLSEEDIDAIWQFRDSPAAEEVVNHFPRNLGFRLNAASVDQLWGFVARQEATRSFKVNPGFVSLNYYPPNENDIASILKDLDSDFRKAAGVLTNHKRCTINLFIRAGKFFRPIAYYLHRDDAVSSRPGLSIVCRITLPYTITA